MEGKYLSNNVAVCDSDEDQSMANIQERFLIVQVKIGKKRIKLEQYSSPILHHTKNKKKKPSQRDTRISSMVAARQSPKSRFLGGPGTNQSSRISKSESWAPGDEGTGRERTRLQAGRPRARPRDRPRARQRSLGRQADRESLFSA